MLSPSAESTIQLVVGSVAPMINLKFDPDFNEGNVTVPPPVAFSINTLPLSAPTRVLSPVKLSTF